VLFSGRRYVAQFHRLLAVTQYLGWEYGSFGLGNGGAHPKYWVTQRRTGFISSVELKQHRNRREIPLCERKR